MTTAQQSPKARNPIYERFVQPVRWPSEFGAVLIGVGSGALGFAFGVVCLIVADALQNADYTIVPIVMAALAIVLSIILPLVSLFVAATATARFYTSEEFALLRITSIQPELIHSGLVVGNHFRLRVIRNIGSWFMLSGIIGIALLVGTMSVIIECFQGPCWNSQVGYSLFGALPAAIIVGAVMAINAFLWMLCINIGVWIGLRAGSNAVVFAGPALAALVAFGAAVVIGTFRLVVNNRYVTGIGGVLICLGIGAIVPLLLFGLVRFMRNDSIKTITRRVSPPDVD